MEIPRTRKPWYRARNVVLAIGAVLAVAIGREIYLALTARPGAAINYAARIRDLIESRQAVPPDAPEAVDGWPILLQALNLHQVARDFVFENDRRMRAISLDYSAIGGPPPDARRNEEGQVLYYPSSTETWADVEAKAREGIRVMRERGLFDLTARMAASNRAARPVRPDEQGRLIGMLLPELSGMRNLARVQKGRMIIAAEEGDWTEFARAFDETMDLGRMAAGQGFLIDFLVGVAIQALAVGEVRVALTQHRVDDPAALRAMLQTIERRTLPPLSFVIEGEELSFGDTLQWTHTDNGRGSGSLIWSECQAFVSLNAATPPGSSGWFKRVGGSRFANVLGVFFASKAQTSRKADEYFDLLQQHAAVAPYARKALPDPEAFIDSLSARYFLLKHGLPGSGSWISSCDYLACAVAGARAQIAVELYRLETGVYPHTLDELTPSILAEAPVDPINGKPLGYWLAPADLLGRPYLLYSFGADGENNMGRRGRDNVPRTTLGPESAKGFDYIFNEPRFVPEDHPPPPPEPPETVDVPAGTESPDTDNPEAPVAPTTPGAPPSTPP